MGYRTAWDTSSLLLRQSPVRAEQTKEVLLAPVNRGQNLGLERLNDLFKVMH